MQYIAYIRDGQSDALFDLDAAEKFLGHAPEDRPVGTHWEASLHLTEDGVWILNEVEFGGRVNVSSFRQVTGDQARAWLEANHYAEAVKRYFERPKGGRPRIGERLITTAPARMHNEIADLAEMYAEPMPDAIRRLLTEALEHRRIIGAPGSREGRQL